MPVTVDFSSRFSKLPSFDKKSIDVGSNLQTTRSELQEACNEIAALKNLIDENYHAAINNVMDISTLLVEMNSMAPFSCIPFPKNRDTITYSEKAGYTQYASAFFKFVAITMTERFATRDSELLMITKQIDQTTINEPFIERSGEIKLPEFADEKAILENTQLEQQIDTMIVANGDSKPATPDVKQSKRKQKN